MGFSGLRVAKKILLAVPCRLLQLLPCCVAFLRDLYFLVAEKILIVFWKQSEEVWIDGCGERFRALRVLVL